MKHDKLRAWAMVEWLTALALLAMVAMITLPNFLEAKTRSDVGQVLVDLRQLATAHTSYRLDNGRWMPDLRDYVYYTSPPISLRENNDPFIQGHLTTPVAYLADIPQDPFRSSRTGFSNYDYSGPGWHRTAEIVEPTYTQDKFLGHWMFLSFGPDRVTSHGVWINFIREREDHGGASPREYDPSNGTVSNGDIVRWENMEWSLRRPQ